jgi:FixJ family two-component response regulator
VTRQDSLVFVVDDDSSMREALSSLLRSEGLRALTFASAEEFLQYSRPPDLAACLVLDVRMPGMTGLELQRRLTGTEQAVPIVFLTGYGDIRMGVDVMKSGAVEFLSKPCEGTELVQAVHRALELDQADLWNRAEQSALWKKYATLTARERQVADLLVKGLLNKQVAAALGIQEITVKVHRRHIMSKMAVKALVDLARMIDRLPLGGASDVGLYTKV